jgi:hypothetical protein
MKRQQKSRPSIADSFIADDVLREVWRIKDEISASYNHNIKRLCADMRKRQFESGHPVVDLSKKYRAEPAAPACVRETPEKDKK